MIISEKPLFVREHDLLEKQSQERRGFGFFRKLKQLIIGSGSTVFRVDKRGIWLGATEFENASARINMKGETFLKRLTLENFVNDDDSSIIYTGTWSQETVRVLCGGTRTKSSTVDDYFRISFSGTSIGLITEKANNLGKLTIYIDDVEIETIDLYSTALLSRSIIWQKVDLENKNHILKGVVATKNPSSSGNGVGFQGYTLFPHPGIKMEQLSCDLYAYGVNLLTDANGYKKTTIAAPIGYSAYCIVGMRLAEDVMGDDTLTDPKLAWRSTEIYLYNGAADTTYSVVVTLLISKL